MLLNARAVHESEIVKRKLAESVILSARRIILGYMYEQDISEISDR